MGSPQAHIALPVEFSELLRERIYPSRLLGLPPENTTRQEIVRAIYEADLRGSAYEDGESITELMERGKKALHFLLDLPSNNTVVITHGRFLRMIMGLILFGDNLTPAEFATLTLVLKSQNTGITLATHSKENPSGGWQMLTWNDHAHLGEVD